VEPINHIVLDLPTPTTGMEGNFLLNDTSEFHIDSDGDASIGGQSLNYAWRVNGGTNINSADNTKFFFRWTGMATTNVTAGTDYGALLSPAGMDRTSDGRLGVRGGASTGIDPNEGFNLGFDLSFLPNTVQLQFVKVGVSDVSGNRIGEIVNRKDTSKRITFGGSSSTASVKFSSGRGDVNVENLNIKLTGGITDYDVASLISTGGTGGFRMNKFVFKIIENGSLSSESFTIDNINPLIIYPNPFKDSITLQNITDITSDCNVKIYAINGTAVFNKTYSGTEANQEIKIHLKTLPQGTYLVQLKNGQEITTRKIIKTTN
jgi:CBS domain-containing protein